VASVIALRERGTRFGDATAQLVVTAPPSLPVPVPVTMTRAFEPLTNDQALWSVIRATTEALSFNNYKRWVDTILCPEDNPDMTALAKGTRDDVVAMAARRALPFPDVDPYRVLKVATEVFMQMNCGVLMTRDFPLDLDDRDLQEERLRILQAFT